MLIHERVFPGEQIHITTDLKSWQCIEVSSSEADALMRLLALNTRAVYLLPEEIPGNCGGVWLYSIQVTPGHRVNDGREVHCEISVAAHIVMEHDILIPTGQGAAEVLEEALSGILVHHIFAGTKGIYIVDTV